MHTELLATHNRYKDASLASIATVNHVSGADCLDLLQRPVRDLRLSVIDQCNFRCTYCMPKEIYTKDYSFLHSESRLSFDQMLTLAKAFVQLGVEKIRITGGEPLLRKGLEKFIETIAKLTTHTGKNVEIALTTNGALLAAKAQSLRDAGLQRVTVSLDSLDNDIFMKMNDVGFPVQKVLGGIEAAQAVGLQPIKVNTVIQKGINDNQIVPLARYFRNTGVIVRFIEFMDVGGAEFWNKESMLSSGSARRLVEQEFPLLPSIGKANDTSRNFKYADGAGEIGFISSMTEPFCSSCTRARVSADGKLFMCLFATKSIDLRSLLQSSASHEQIASVIRGHWQLRDDRYSELHIEKRTTGSKKIYRTVRMSLVGG
ncbi:GTP 3',8-cyclase MoaA [Undibacterium sp. Jales W-56]|uniref:GTP 3',8-cyclase MoaA n=1 Tax=Undibacterium sp. Jales W-56 TaxID=2897325 RepID=UPI0021D086CD|nr:GTP 3',8-cyclase MoaA [Undibacterium sp. Jales W-56]MCU6433354.1 GTP 3',8-cyclase MoaA [Undibacterium sp. Jales W-56]